MNNFESSHKAKNNYIMLICIQFSLHLIMLISEILRKNLFEMRAKINENV